MYWAKNLKIVIIRFLDVSVNEQKKVTREFLQYHFFTTRCHQLTLLENYIHSTKKVLFIAHLITGKLDVIYIRMHTVMQEHLINCSIPAGYSLVCWPYCWSEPSVFFIHLLHVYFYFFQKCWSEDGASPCVLIETPHKELEPADPSSFKQYRFKNLFIKASPIPRLR